jgi:hypothetical protein
MAMMAEAISVVPKKAEKKKVDRPIRQTLLPSLILEHPELEGRGISKETGEYLDAALCRNLENAPSPVGSCSKYAGFSLMKGIRQH